MKTKVIALIAQKGGCGKSTNTVHLAMAAQQAGYRVAVLDMDVDQRSTKGWAETRKKAQLPAFPVYSPADSELDTVIEAARNDGVDLVFLDAPPHAAPLATRIARAADLCLVPVSPDLFNMRAVPASMAIVGEKKSAFVMSNCPPRAPENADLRAYLEKKGWPILGPIHQKRIVARSINSGHAVGEMEPEGASTKEFAVLFSNVLEMLK